MTTLAAGKSRDFKGADSKRGSLPVVATDIIWHGAAIGSSSGNARPLVAGDAFQGFAMETVDNSTGSAGAKRVEHVRAGTIKLTVGGVDGTDDVSGKVYASDDDTFSITATTGNSFIGVVSQHVSGTTCWVDFDADEIARNA